METIKISPRGYCHGVVNAINTISKLAEMSTTKSITILGMVIHNKQVVDYFSAKGIKTLHDPSKTRLELLDQIDDGVVVFTAHGVSPQVHQKALDKGLEIIDTTCGDVTKSHDAVKELLLEGYQVLFIGKHAHPESEGVTGYSNDVYVVETIDELEQLNLTGKIALTNQTTMSLYDIYHIAEKAREIYPNIHFVDEICNATRIRQEAVSKVDSSVDHVYIVGDAMSNNSNKLAQVAIEQANVSSSLIEHIEDIDVDELKAYRKVAVSSGASTPTQVTNEVIKFLQQFDPDDPATHQNKTALRTETLLQRKALK